MLNFTRKLARLKANAKRRRLAFNLTSCDLLRQWKAQDGFCAISRLPFQPKGDEMPSVDRIDSFKGYEKGNIQFVHLWVNRAKGQASDQEIKERFSRVRV